MLRFVKKSKLGRIDFISTYTYFTLVVLHLFSWEMKKCTFQGRDFDFQFLSFVCLFGVSFKEIFQYF